MKLHLPVRLFRAVMALLLAAPSALYAAYTAPTTITIPSGYTTRTVDAISDITYYSKKDIDVAFLVDASCFTNGVLTIDACPSTLMTTSADSWLFTSASASSAASLTFSNSTKRLFEVAFGESLQFIALNKILFEGNEYTASFSYAPAGPSSGSPGGPIYGDASTSIILSDNGSVTFRENSATSDAFARGGAIWGYTITMGDNGSVTFSENTTSSSSVLGGAIYGNVITMIDNGNVTFSGNEADSSDVASGGAIWGSRITLSENRSVKFSGNVASSSYDDSYVYAYGGAIWGYTITMSDNGSVTFSENTASSSFDAMGGAIYEDSDSGGITLSGNESVTFSENTASSSYDDSNSHYAHGGAIYGKSVSLIENGSVTFSENTVSSYYNASGGAIYTLENLSISNNDTVLFEKNAEICEGVHRLRSIYASGRYAVISLSAAENGNIEFRDSIYIAEGNTVKFNADYTDAKGEVYEQTGDIIFSGAYVEEHLRAIKGSEATAEEIELSRTSEVLAMTNLYAGRLRVEDGAIYRGYGITAMSGSTVQLHDGSMNHFSNAINVQSGATLALRGVNSITAGSVSLAAGSTLSFHVSTKHTSEAILTLSGSLVMPQNGGELTLQLSKDNFVSGVDSYMLLTGVTKPLGWDEYTINITSGTLGWSVSFDDLTWVDNTLWLYYDEDPPHGGGGDGSEEDANTLEYIGYSKTGDAPKGGALDATAGDKVELSGYDSILFKENYVDAEGDGKAYGGAIYGDNTSPITLSDNGSVTFSGNSVSTTGSYADAMGGAIYGSSITLSDNESVTFSGNSVSTAGSSSYAYAGAVYGRIITLSGNGSVTFSGNTASGFEFTGAGAIYCGSSITLSDNESVTFSGNTASGSSDALGGAIYGDYSSDISLSGNESVTFSGNTASSSDSSAYGGAIYGASSSTITLSDNGSVSFSENTASASGRNAYGGAIYGDFDSIITLSDNGNVTFSGNTVFTTSADAYGGAIYGHSDSAITLSDNGNVTFSGNTASATSSAYGGAISGRFDSSITLSGNRNVLFSGNSTSSTSAYGGAIYGDSDSVITLSDNGNVTFSGNTASSTFASGGGAIYGSTITLSGNENVEFNENTTSSTSAIGGAIYGSSITLSENEIVEFSENSAASSGGAIYGSTITLSENVSVSFNGNTVSLYGGAICGDRVSIITLSGNGSVSFSGNTASSSSNVAFGGAIYGSTIALSGNEIVEFSGNTAIASTSYACGGAIYGSTIALSGNEIVEFSGNTASSDTSDAYACGGAINVSSITLSENESVLFSGNTASASKTYALGGAISAFANLSICNNDAVLFEKNAEISNGFYRLRSIYAVEGSGVISLSSAEASSIEFRDSIYIASGCTVSFNADYTDAEGVVHKQTGDILFTGAYVEDALYTVKGNIAGTAEEILASRTSEVYAMTNLYGGRLRVEDGAIYKGHGITVATGSNSTVCLKDASLEHSGYQVNFAGGTTLQVSGVSTVTAMALNMGDGSTLSLCVSAQNMDEAVLTLSGEFIQGGHLYVDLQMGGTSLSAGSYKLLTFDSAPTSWTSETITIQGAGQWDVSFDDLVWDGQTLVWNVTNTEWWWANGSGNRIWRTSDANWERDGVSGGFQDGDRLYFADAGSGTVKLVGELAPSAVIVDNSAKKAYTWTGSGYLIGDMSLQKSGAGTLTIHTANQYSGGTTLIEGTLVAGNNMAFGSDVIKVEGGTLDLKGKAVGNDIFLDGSAIIKGGTKYTGQFVMESGELMKGSVLNVAQSSVLWGGVMNGTLSGTGTVYVTDVVQLGDAAKLTTNGLNITGTLNVGSKGLTMNAKSSDISISGGTLASEGKLSAYSLTMVGGALDVSNAKPMTVTLTGVANLSAGARVDLYGAFTAADLDMNKATFTLAMDDGYITTKSLPKPQKITLKDKNATSELTNGSTLDVMGSMSVAGGLKLSDSTLSLHDWDEAQKPKAQTLTVKGALEVNDSELSLNGKLTAASLAASGADIKLENTTAAQSIALTLAKDTQKQVVVNSLTKSTIDVAGSMTVAGALALTDSSISLHDIAGAAKPKAMGLTVKDALTIADAAKDAATELALTGKLSAARLTLDKADIKLENTTAAQSIALTLAKDTQKQLVTNSLTDSTIDATGSMTVAGALALTDSSISLHDIAGAAKPKAMGLTVKDALTIADENKDAAPELALTGKLSAPRLTLDKADITLENETAAQSIALTLAKDTQKQVVVNSFTNSTIDATGSMTVAGALTLTDSSIFLHDVAGATKPKAMGLTVKDALTIADAAKDAATELALTGKLSAARLTLDKADITLENETAAQSIALTLAKDTQKQVVVNSFTNSTIDATGSMTVAGALEMTDSSINLHDIAGAAKPKAMGLTVKGALDITDADRDAAANELYLTGKLTAGSLNMTNAEIKLENTTAAQSISLTLKADAQKNPITNTLTDSRIYANGSMSVAGHLSLQGASSIHLEDTAKGKAMNLAVKGDLTLGSGSSITLSGALSAANMTLNGGSINLTSTKLQTIKVSKELTFGGSITLGLQEGLDIKMGKSYNLFTYKTLAGVDETTNLYALLGLADEYCTLTLDLKKKAITLMVTEEEWNQWVTDHTTKTELEPEEASIEAVAATAAEVEPGITTAAAVEEELPEEEEAEATVVTTTLPVQQAADVEALIAKVSDTLAQTTWGTAKASRAFVDSIGNRGQNATAMAEGRGAAWGGVIGATSRLSSHGGSLGADHTLSGAVFGAEMNATDAHSIGLAMGVTWGEINTLSAYNVDQDSTHLAAYGQSRLGKSLTLDWSAAYGRSENDADILGSSYDWTQHALQLDARLSYAYALNERTTLRGFGGMQYLHIDSDTPEKGMKADSMQNVRVEVGVGATYMATAKTAVYGEVSFIGDIVRDNPATHIGGTCRGGSNPGRAGMNMTVGATHALNENWSLNASYNMELQPRANAHNATIGATYRF